MKFFWGHWAILMIALGLVWGDETVPTPPGLTFRLTGDGTHYQTGKEIVVKGAKDDGVFSQEIFGNSMTAVFSGLPPAHYTVIVDVAETYHHDVDQRVMKVAVGETVLADHLDIFKAAGFATAYQIKGQVDHAADQVGGPLTVTFSAIKDKAKFNAIHLLAADGSEVVTVKARDLISAEDMLAAKVPEVAGPVLYIHPPPRPFELWWLSIGWPSPKERRRRWIWRSPSSVSTIGAPRRNRTSSIRVITRWRLGRPRMIFAKRSRCRSVALKTDAVPASCRVSRFPLFPKGKACTKPELV